MKLAKRVFFGAGVYGLIALAPLYFLERYFGEQNPPAVTHPEFYYGFIGVGLAWQVLFLIVARDPLRFRPMMIPAMLEKFSYAGAVFVLLALGPVAASIVATAAIDLLLGLLFIWSYVATRRGENSR